MSVHMTTERAIELSKQLEHPFQVISVYQTSRDTTAIDLECLICGHVTNVYAANLRRNDQQNDKSVTCQICNSRKHRRGHDRWHTSRLKSDSEYRNRDNGLYLLKVQLSHGDYVYKVGVGDERRLYNHRHYGAQVVWSLTMSSLEAFTIERELLARYRSGCKVLPENWPLQGGRTEIIQGGIPPERLKAEALELLPDAREHGLAWLNVDETDEDPSEA